MVKPPERVRQKPITYKTELTLLERQWERLAAEAKRRNVSGRALIEAALSQYIHTLPILEDVPLPEAPPEDA